MVVDKAKQSRQYLVTETNTLVGDTESTVENSNVEDLFLKNKGPNSVFMRTDGTVATAGAAGNADEIPIGATRRIEFATIPSISLICSAAQTANVFTRQLS